MAIKVANNQSLTAITALPSAVSGGAMTLISTQTASSSATISFTSGIDSTYDEYVFKFINIHPENDGPWFQFNGSIDGGSNYNATKTTTFFHAIHQENDGTASLAYHTSLDLAQSSDPVYLNTAGGDADENQSGYLHLFNPSSTTFVKHFIARVVGPDNTASANCKDNFIAGYFNTTSAVDAIKFEMSSGDIDAGVIKLYGIS